MSAATPGKSTTRATVSSRDSCVANSVTHDGHAATGQVEEEDRLPGDVLDEEAADDRADGQRQRADTPAHVPIALPRSSGGKALVMIDEGRRAS